MSHAQVNSNAPNPVTTPAASIPSTTSAPPTTGSQGAALSTILNTAQPALPTVLPTQITAPTPITGKYEEFQSVCRTNDYDTLAYYNDQLKEQRINLIKNHIAKSPTNISYSLRLLKELADQKKLKDLQTAMIDLKTKKLSITEQHIADATLAFAKKDKKTARDHLNAVLSEYPKNIEALNLLAEVYLNDKNYFESASIYFDLKKITNKNYDEALCESYTLDDHYAEAEDYCFKEIGKNKSPFASIYLGIASREQKKFKEAKKYFKNSLKTKETEMGYVCLGEMFDMEKNYSEAADSFKKALEVVPKSDRAHVALAWAYFKDRKRSEASEQFQKACALNSKIIVEVRKAIKTLIDEKSDSIAAYAHVLKKCESF